MSKKSVKLKVSVSTKAINKACKECEKSFENLAKALEDFDERNISDVQIVEDSDVK